jgi:hypothetical protein
MSVYNPISGKQIKSDSKLGQALTIIQSFSKTEIEDHLKRCTSSLVYNPVSKRCLKATTKDGQAVLAAYEFYLSNDFKVQNEMNRTKVKRTKNSNCSDFPEKIKEFVPRDHQIETLNQFKNNFNITQGILLYWGLGMGKSCGAAMLLDYCLKINPEYNIYVLTTAGTRDNFKIEYCSICGEDPERLSRFKFITYNYTLLSEQLDQLSQEEIDNSVFVIDEFHNVISGYLNESTNYSRLFEVLKSSEDSKFILMSGTPIQDKLKEIFMILTLLLPDKYRQYDDFRDQFVENDQGQFIPPEELLEDLKLIVSHQESNDPSLFPKVFNSKITVPMSDYQYQNYLVARNEELTVRKPEEKFRISNPRLYESMETKSFLAKIMYKSIGECNCSYPERAKGKEDKLVEDGGWIDEEFIQNILKYAPKVYVIIQFVMKYQAKHLIFTRYVRKHGVNLISSLLKYFNVPHLIFSGESSNRQEIIDKFNSENNLNGEQYRVLIFTRAGSEGLNIFQVRFFFALEQYIRSYILYQAKGRAVRLNSHQLLPEDMRDIMIIELFAITPGSNVSFNEVMKDQGQRKTSDFFAYEEMEKKRFKIQLIIDLLNRV